MSSDIICHFNQKNLRIYYYFQLHYFAPLRLLVCCGQGRQEAPPDALGPGDGFLHGWASSLPSLH